MKKIIYILILLPFFSCLPNKEAPTTEEDIDEISTSQKNVTIIEIDSLLDEIILDGGKIGCQLLDSVELIDSIQHSKLKTDFPKTFQKYSRFSPLGNCGIIELNSNYTSKLILQCLESWGTSLLIANYNSKDQPMNVIPIVTCGGDGGFGKCSKARFKKDTCIIEYRLVDSSDDYLTFYETKMKKTFKVSDSLKLTLINTVSKTDTINYNKDSNKG